VTIALTTAEIASALGNAHREGDGYRCRCPLSEEHNNGDASPSFSIREHGSTILIRCHSRHADEQPRVIEAFKALGLWRAPNRAARRRAERQRPTSAKDDWIPLPVVQEEAPDPNVAAKYFAKKFGVIDEALRFDYRNVRGELLFHVYRFEPPGKPKEIRPFTLCRHRVSGKLEWRSQWPPAPLPVYRLESLAEHPNLPVLLLEGEKKTDAAAKLLRNFYVPIGLPGGAKAIGKIDFSSLAGRHVVAFPDNDTDGCGAMAEALSRVESAQIEQFGTITRIARIVKPPPAWPLSHDIADAIDEGWDAERLLDLISSNSADVDEFEIYTRERFGKPNAAVNPEVGGDTLLFAIREAALSKEITGFDKKRTIAKLIRSALLDNGHLCRTVDSQLFYFRKSERKLYDLDAREFCHLITTESGLSGSETYFRFTLDALQAEAARLTPSAVHTLGHYDTATGRLAVSDGGSGVWVRDRGGEWIRSHNGADGLLFFGELDSEPWEPDFPAADGAMAWFLDQFSFADHNPLAATDSASLFLVALLQQYFPILRRTRILPTFLGPQGSGKSTNMRLTGRILVGPGFDVTGVRREKEDAFVAGVTNRTVLALDNADSKIDWLEDGLATYATGLRHQLRRLYSTNDEVSYRPRAFLMLSSRDAHFRRADVAERLLMLHCKRPDAYLPEDAIFGEVERRRGAVMADVLRLLAQAADAQQVAAPAMQFRMADYASFGWKLFRSRGREAEWVDLLRRVERTQTEFAGEGDGLIETLRLLLEQRGGAVPEIESAALFNACSEIASERGLWLPRSASGFGQKLTLMARIIEAELDVKFTDRREHGRRRIITIEPRQSRRGDVGDVGDDELQTPSDFTKRDSL
jgi:hypothetical protein